MPFRSISTIASFFMLLLVASFPFFSTNAYANVVCNTYTYTGHDDSAYPANLPFTLKLGPTEYDNVFITSNGTLTFGQPDANFSSYPNTPSVSVAGYDWVTFGEGAYVSFGSTANTLCVEWSLRPYPQSTGDLTQIRLVINKYPNGTWHGEVTTFGWLPADLRRGIRYVAGEPVVTIEGAFDVGDGGIPVEVTPAPTPPSFTEPPVIPSETPTPEPTPTETTPEPTPEPTPIEPTPLPTETVTPTPTDPPSPEPSPSDTPTPEPTPEPSNTSTPSLEPTPEVVVPTPVVTQTPEPEPTASVVPTLDPEPTPIPEPIQSESPFPEPVTEPEPSLEEATQEIVDESMADGVLTDDERELVADALLEEFAGEPVSFEAFEASGLDYEDLPPETPITLENGVILTAEVADAIEIFDTPTELLSTVFSDPGKALKALASVGADMTEEEREVSQNIVVAAVVVTQVAQVRRIK